MAKSTTSVVNLKQTSHQKITPKKTAVNLEDALNKLFYEVYDGDVSPARGNTMIAAVGKILDSVKVRMEINNNKQHMSESIKEFGNSQI